MHVQEITSLANAIYELHVHGSCACFIFEGKWVLTRSYVDDSCRAGRWLDEERYECSVQWRHPETRQSELPAASRWRQHVEQVHIQISITYDF